MISLMQEVGSSMRRHIIRNLMTSRASPITDSPVGYSLLSVDVSNTQVMGSSMMRDTILDLAIKRWSCNKEVA